MQGLLERTHILLGDEKLARLQNARVFIAGLGGVGSFAAEALARMGTMMVENKEVNLSAGMAVTVEVKTGTRRVIEYFLKPFLESKNESLRER